MNSGCFKKGMIPWNKGKTHSKEARKKISMSKLGHIPWNKGIGIYIEGIKNPMFGKHHSQQTKELIRKRKLGTKLSKETKEKITLVLLKQKRGGSRHWNWQGGKTKEYQIIRVSYRYKQWRKAIFERDNYTCVMCGHKSMGDIQADHIKPFSLYPEIRFELSNGRTLCIPCHKLTDTYSYKMYQYRKTI